MKWRFSVGEETKNDDIRWRTRTNLRDDGVSGLRWKLHRKNGGGVDLILDLNVEWILS